MAGYSFFLTFFKIFYKKLAFFFTGIIFVKIINLMVELRNYKTGKLLQVPNELYNKCYKSKADIWEVISDDIREPMPHTVIPSQKVIEHIESIKKECMKECEKPECCKEDSTPVENPVKEVKQPVTRGRKPVKK